MTSSASNKHPSSTFWPSVAPYLEPPLAASAAMIPVFRDMAAKSALQKGEPIPSMTIIEGCIRGFKSAPTVGLLIGTQLVAQRQIEKMYFGSPNSTTLPQTIASSAVVALVSVPFIAVFNGQTMGWGVRDSLRRLSSRQACAIVVQETAFVGGLSAADKVANMMRGVFGNNKTVDYASAFIAGATGSLAGHPANTAFTRWQCGLKVDSFGQTMWGAARKARAVGCFSVLYKLGKETLTSGGVTG